MREIDYILIEDLESLMDKWMKLLDEETLDLRKVEKEKKNGKL